MQSRIIELVSDIGGGKSSFCHMATQWWIKIGFINEVVWINHRQTEWQDGYDLKSVENDITLRLAESSEITTIQPCVSVEQERTTLLVIDHIEKLLVESSSQEKVDFRIFLTRAYVLIPVDYHEDATLGKPQP